MKALISLLYKIRNICWTIYDKQRWMGSLASWTPGGEASLNLLLRSHHIIITDLWSLHAELLQLCPTLCDPMDCRPPCSSVYGILQAEKLESVDMLISGESSWPRDQTRVSSSLHCQRGSLPWAPSGKPRQQYGGCLKNSKWKVQIVKAMVFSVVMFGCESWPTRRLSAEELMLSNSGAGEDSWESLGQRSVTIKF